MSSENEGNPRSEPTDVKGAVPRARSESECSGISDDGTGVHSPGKRQRTTSQTFMVAGSMTAASPPKFVSLEEIIRAANGIKDMALVHQIVVDKDFKLERYEPEPNTLHRAVKDNMQKAFWEVLRQELAEDPPNYNQAFILLDDVRNGLFALLFPQHTKIKQQISDVLDTELIRQQAERGVLDFKHYADYVLGVMSKLCAPVRDDQITALQSKTDVIAVFKGILETLDLMALDMANFTIEMVKPEIIAHSVELERKKFADYLSVQTDGLEHTRKWLLSHLDHTLEKPANTEAISYVKNITKETFTTACLDLLEWEENSPFPETFMLDQARLLDLKARTTRLILTGTVLLIAVSNVSPDIQSLSSFKQAIKDHTMVLFQSQSTEKEMLECLPNIAEQVITDIKEAQKKHNFREISEDSARVLKEQLSQVSKPDNRIRELVRKRVKEFFLQIIRSSTADPQKVPSGLTSLQRELSMIAGQFLRIVAHNSTVFCTYYFDIVDEALTKRSKE